MEALIDGDLVAYINAASCSEDDPEYVALIRTEERIRKILTHTQATTYRIFLSGGNNFRYEINPQYKANRTAPDPIHRRACHQFLIDEWKAEEATGYEADDALGCNQTENTIICSLDKDLRMIPGKHYSWEISRKGVIIREPEFAEVSYMDGIKHFYKQMIIGDTSDNIFGVVGLGKAKAAKIIDPLETEDQMKAVVASLYNDDERFVMNADCLWIWRSLGVTYTTRDCN